MPLRGRKPEAIQKRLKMFLFSPAGVGKTTASIQFPRSYIIDGEKGAENYEKLINKSQSQVFQTTDMGDVIQEVKALLTEPHEYRTLVIDPITTIYNDLLDKAEQKVGSEFGRHYGAANKEMKRLANLLMALDMNIIITAHAKKEYGDNLQVLGQTFDGWRQLDYWFDLVVRLERRGTRRVGVVIKTRIETFPDGDTFDWSYDEIRKRWDVGTLERAASTVQLAAPQQVAQVKELLSVVSVPDGQIDKWFSKAGVECWEDMPADAVAKCIDYVRNRLPALAASA